MRSFVTCSSLWPKLHFETMLLISMQCRDCQLPASPLFPLLIEPLNFERYMATKTINSRFSLKLIWLAGYEQKLGIQHLGNAFKDNIYVSSDVWMRSTQGQQRVVRWKFISPLHNNLGISSPELIWQLYSVRELLLACLSHYILESLNLHIG